MARTYEDSSGRTFSTHDEAAASNTAMGTNPSVNRRGRNNNSTTTTPTTPTITPYQGMDVSGFVDYLAQNNILTDNSPAGVAKAKAIAVNTLNNNTSITTPPKPTVTNPFSAITAGNYGLGLADGQGNPVTKQPETTTTTVDNTGISTTATTNTPYMDTLRSILGLKEQNPVPNLTNEYLNAEKSSGVQALQQIVNDKTAELNAITAKATADQLQLRQTGSSEGVTEAVYGGQQAQIAREAAIKALPLQAEIAAAQGNLQFAQNRLDTLFKLKSQDAQNQFDYKNKLIDYIYDAASKDQQNQLDSKRLSDKQAHDDAQNNIARQDQWAKLALDSNQPNLISAIHNIDPYSSTFNAQLGAVTGQLSGNTLDNQYKKLQIAKLTQELSGTGEDPSTVLAYAQQYASNGAIPTGLPKGMFGLVSQVAKELPKVNGEIVDNNTNIKSSKVTATQADAYGSLKDLTIKLDQASALFKELNTGLIGGTLGNVFPSQKRQEYAALRSEIVDLLARARTGAAISANEEAMYKAKIPGTFNQFLGLGASGENKLKGLKSSIETKLDTQLRANGVSMYGFSKVKLGGKDYVVGQIIDVNGQQGRVNPDGTITAL